MLRLFDRKPAYAAALFAEAQALVDDGLEPQFVLDLYPEEAVWLAGMLGVSDTVASAYEAEAPSYYFEASLKAKFLAAARRQADPAAIPAGAVLVPATQPGGFRTAFAAGGVLAATALVAVMAVGFVTADDSVSGDWNYTFKMANERIDYTLSSGDDRVNVQLRHTEARVQELRKVTVNGNVSAGDLERLQREANDLAELLNDQDLDEYQMARLKGLLETSAVAINSAINRNPELAVAAVDAEKSVSDVAAAAGLGPTALITPEPTPEPTATPTSEPTATPEPEATPTPDATPTPAPATPEPTEAATTESAN